VQAIAAPAPHEVISAIAGVSVPAEASRTTKLAAHEPDDSGDEVVEERKPTLDELIALRVHNVTPERIEEMRRLFPGVSLDEIASMSAVGATPEFIRELRREGLEIRRPDDATGLAAVGVTPEFLREIRATGIPVKDPSDIQGMAAVGVSAKLIRELRAAGIAVETANEAQSLAAVGVTPEYVRRMKRAGVPIDETSDVQSLRALGITPEFVERLARAGYTHLTVEQLNQWTARTLANSPYRDQKLDETSPLPKIDHVIYIVKENRSYDQVLGDLKPGNGDPSLVLFGENSTPNLHKLAREFVLLDNFYVNSDVSADGHNWSAAAIAPDYVQKMWPNKYANRRATYDFEEQDAASLPPAGYLWTNAAAAGISIRNFGYMVNNKPNAAPGAEQITGVRDPVLAKVTNPFYRGFDLDYTDVDRAKVFLNELAEYEKSGTMPRLTVMRLGNDHTSGTAAGKIAPLSAAADNDYAVGQLVEGVSKSRFWASTAIFILEDDAQNGPDHVDSHRSPAFVISPWVKRHAVDSSMYNTTSMLRTMEFLLGLKPMTHFDAGARPMTAAFQSQPNTAPYAAEKPRISLDEKNPAATPAAARAARMNFEEADENDDDELNDILWRAIRKDAPPPPVRSIFGR